MIRSFVVQIRSNLYIKYWTLLISVWRTLNTISKHAYSSSALFRDRVTEPRVVLRKGHAGIGFYFIFSGSVFVNVEELLKRTGHVMWHTFGTLQRGDSFGVSTKMAARKEERMCHTTERGGTAVFLDRQALVLHNRTHNNWVTVQTQTRKSDSKPYNLVHLVKRLLVLICVSSAGYVIDTVNCFNLHD